MIYVAGKLILETGEEVNGMDQDFFVVTFNRQPGESRKTTDFNYHNLYTGKDSESVFFLIHM